MNKTLLNILDWFATPFKWFGGLFSKNKPGIVWEEMQAINSNLAAVAEPADKEAEAEKWRQYYQNQEKRAIEATGNNFKRFSESQISLHELVLEACLGMVAIGRTNGEFFEARKIYEAVYSEHNKNKILNILEENEGSLTSPENKAILSELKAVVTNEITKNEAIEKSEIPALEPIEQEPVKTAGCTK